MAPSAVIAMILLLPCVALVAVLMGRRDRKREDASADRARRMASLRRWRRSRHYAGPDSTIGVGGGYQDSQPNGPEDDDYV